MGDDAPLSASLTVERVVIEEKLASETSVREAKRTALRRHVHLVEVLIDEHTVDEHEFAEALSRRLGIERVRVGKVDEEAVLEVPHDVAAAHLAVPISLSGEPRTLTVAMVDPLDANALRDIADGTGCSIETKVATLSDIRNALPRLYSHMITKMIPRLPRPGDARADPSTQPHVELPDERSLEVRFRALLELLNERGIVSTADFEERVRRLTRGEDV